MKQQITVTGLVATTPRHLVTFEGLGITSFRLASESAGGSDDFTNWYTVTILGDGAKNAESSISKGDRVLVFGDFKIRDWDNGERSGTSVEIVATTIGHDLRYGTTDFKRPETVTEAQPATQSHKCDCGMCGAI